MIESDMLIPPFASRQEVKKNEHFLMASPIQQVAPVYPPALVQEIQPPTVICVEFVIGREGKVTHVTPLHEHPPCEDTLMPANLPFRQAAEAAVWQWSFFAAAICKPDPQTDDCGGPLSVVTAIPIKLAYSFTFSSTDGEPSVDGHPWEAQRP